MTKMTMFIDEKLLDRVMRITGLKTKTETVGLALQEAERNAKLMKFLALERLSEEDLRDSVDPGYDLMALRAAEVPPKYRNKRGSR